MAVEPNTMVLVRFHFQTRLTCDRCNECHTNPILPRFLCWPKLALLSNGCANCHTASRVGSVHGAQVTYN